MLPAECSVPTFLQTKTRVFRSARLHNLESRLKQVGAISENLPRFEVLQKPSADADCQGNWLEADELQPGAQLGPISRCSITGGSLGAGPSAASLGWCVGRWEVL